jgi:hypothetical protein
MKKCNILLIKAMGGVQKGQKHADIIYGWSLTNQINKNLIFAVGPE